MDPNKNKPSWCDEVSHNICNVPIFKECVIPGGSDNSFLIVRDGEVQTRVFDETWIKAAVQYHMVEKENNTPLIVASGTPKSSVAGRTESMYSGVDKEDGKYTLWADLCWVKDSVYQRIASGELSGISIEVAQYPKPIISRVALFNEPAIWENT